MGHSGFFSRIKRFFGGGSKEVKSSKTLGQVFVKPSENRKTFGPGVSVPGRTGGTTSGRSIGGPGLGRGGGGSGSGAGAISNIGRGRRRGGGGGGGSRGGGGSSGGGRKIGRSESEIFKKELTKIGGQKITSQGQNQQRQQETIVRQLESKREEPRNLISKVGGVLSDRELGRKFIGVGVPGTSLFISGEKISRNLPSVTGEVFGASGIVVSPRTIISGREEIKKDFESRRKSGRFVGGVVSEFIPKTAGESLILGAGIAVPFIAPPLVTTGLSLGFGALGTKQALDTSLTPQKRVAGGLVGITGLAGGAFGVTPFIRGARARVFGGVKTAKQGFKFVSSTEEIGEVGLIPKGSPRTYVNLPKTSPLRRGGFGVKQSEKILFLGQEQKLATSQVGLFKSGRKIPIEREFFVSPQEPTLGIAETRVSRLGLVEPFKMPRNVKIGFGAPGRPQIGIIKEGVIGKTETTIGFKIGKGSELEGIKTFGSITNVQKIGERSIRGQGVELFEFKIGKGKRGLSSESRGFSSTKESTRLSGETILTSTTTKGLITNTIPRITGSISGGGSFGLTNLNTPKIETSLPPTSIGTPILTAPKSPPTISSGTSPRSIPLLPPLSPITPSGSPIMPGEKEPFLSKRKKKGTAERKKKKIKKKKGKKPKVPIRPSFTGIVLGIEAPAFETTIAGRNIGVLPGSIRGLETGFKVPKKKAKKKVKKKSTKKTK